MSALTAEQVQALIRFGVPMAEDIDLYIDRLERSLRKQAMRAIRDL